MRKGFVFCLFFLLIASFYSYGEGEVINPKPEVPPEEREYNRCVFINIFHEYSETNTCLMSEAKIEQDQVDHIKARGCFRKTALKIKTSMEECTTHEKEIAEMKIPEIASEGDDYYYCIAKGVLHEYHHTQSCLVFAKAMTAVEELGITITSSGHLDFTITTREYLDSGVTVTKERPLDPIKSALCLRATALTMKHMINNCGVHLKPE